MKNSSNFSAYLLLGTGFISIHNADVAKMMEKAGFKIHTFRGKTFGLSLFTLSI